MGKKKKEKKGNDNEFRDFLRRNGLILLLIMISVILIGTLLIIKKNKVLLYKEENQIKEKLILEKTILNKSVISTSKAIVNKIITKKSFNCNDLQKKGINKNGIYEIYLKNTEKKIKVYCDMKTAGGGWTLLLTSVTNGWDKKDILKKNELNPSISSNYSILGKADALKTVKNGKYQYRIDAKEFGRNGGIWEAPEEYSFVSNSKNNINIKLISQFGNWKYYTYGIEKRMPYICNSRYALLTTSINCDVKWYGTLVAKGGDFFPAPWIHNLEKNPGVIWYWVK